MNRIAANITILLIAIGLAGTAAAADRSDFALAGKPEAVRATVALGDLDLSSEAARRTAEQRVRRAIHRLCSAFVDERKVDSWVTFTECSREGLARAQVQIRSLAAARMAAAEVPSTLR